MRTEVCETLGIEFPLFAFSHCRDVVAAVTNAGGFGVLGAVAYTPEQLERSCAWIDDHVGGRPYGVDVLVPGKNDGGGGAGGLDALLAAIPDEHWEFLDRAVRAVRRAALPDPDAPTAARRGSAARSPRRARPS